MILCILCVLVDVYLLHTDVKHLIVEFSLVFTTKKCKCFNESFYQIKQIDFPGTLPRVGDKARVARVLSFAYEEIKLIPSLSGQSNNQTNQRHTRTRSNDHFQQPTHYKSSYIPTSLTKTDITMLK